MKFSDTENIEQIKQEILEANDFVWNLRASPKPGYEPELMVKQAYEKSLHLNFQFGEARCLLNMGMGAFILHHNYPLSEEYISRAIKIFQDLGDEKWEANAYLTIAIIKNSTGNPESALYLGLKGIEFYRNRKDDYDFTMAYYVVGTIYKDLKKPEEAEKYYRDGVGQNVIQSTWSARVYTGLSNILSDRGEFEGALEMGHRGLEALRSEENQIGISRALNDLGSIYHRLKDYDKALEYIFEALKIRKENNIKHFVLGSLIDIAGIYFELEKFDVALPYYNEAEPIAIETNHLGRLAHIYSRQADIYKHVNDLANAVNTYEKLIELNNKIKLQEQQLKISQSENKLLKEREEEIERLRNVELKNAYDLIAEKNKEITDSIHYAKRIQNTILSPEVELKKYLGEYFIYFQPKDIVSGDFYWSIVMKRDDGSEDFYLAVCDSTGHGVPGAFMSLLNTNLLNEAIYEKQIAEPNRILNYVRQRLIDSISKEGQKDGFDGILIRYCREKKKLSYAAGNNAPLIIRKTKIIELSADKMPVGFGEKTDSFELHEVDLQLDDSVYLFTDGYADQFGGDKGKKFRYKSLYELLSLHAAKDAVNQHEIIKSTFEKWRGNLEQVDDVCIVGFKVR